MFSEQEFVFSNLVTIVQPFHFLMPKKQNTPFKLILTFLLNQRK